MSSRVLTSKLNFLRAEHDNYNSCMLFDDKEIAKLQAPLKEIICSLEAELMTLQAKEIETSFEIVNAPIK